MKGRFIKELAGVAVLKIGRPPHQKQFYWNREEGWTLNSSRASLLSQEEYENLSFQWTYERDLFHKNWGKILSGKLTLLNVNPSSEIDDDE